MPRGVPRLGQALTSVAEELTAAPHAQTLGTIDPSKLNVEPPPPWATDPNFFRSTNDARKYVDAPSNVVFRWMNPAVVRQSGQRYWETVPAKGDSRFKLKVRQLQAPDNTVRRGSHEGDFLTWMYRSWYDDLLQRRMAKARAHAGSGRKRQEDLSEAFRSGQYHNVTLGSPPQHPTATGVDGKLLRELDP